MEANSSKSNDFVAIYIKSTISNQLERLVSLRNTVPHRCSKYDRIKIFLPALASTVNHAPPFTFLQTIDEVHRHRVAVVLGHQ